MAINSERQTLEVKARFPSPHTQIYEPNKSGIPITEVSGKDKSRKVYGNKPTRRAEFLTFFGKRIEEFDSMKRALEGQSKKSADGYYYGLAEYFLYLKENPDQVIVNRRNDLNSTDCEQWERYERLTKAYIKNLIEIGYAGKGIKSIKGRIGGFFRNNSKRYALDLGKLQIPKARKRQKYSPFNEEVRHLYAFADSARDRLILILMYQNGLPPVDVSQIDVGDLPTEPWTYYEKSRSKTGEVWCGVVTPEMSHELKILLKQLGNPESNNKNNIRERNCLFRGRQGPLDEIAISQLVQGLIKKSGLGENDRFKPTSLRDAYEDSLVSANVHPKIKEALMGHTSDIEHEYGGHNRLVITVVEASKKAYSFLTLTDLKVESSKSKNEIEELKTLLEQKYLEIGRIIQEKNEEIMELQKEVQRIKLLKPSLETLLRRVEEIENRLKVG